MAAQGAAAASPDMSQYITRVEAQQEIGKLVKEQLDTFQAQSDVIAEQRRQLPSPAGYRGAAWPSRGPPAAVHSPARRMDRSVASPPAAPPAHMLRASPPSYTRACVRPESGPPAPNPAAPRPSSLHDAWLERRPPDRSELLAGA